VVRAFEDATREELGHTGRRKFIDKPVVERAMRILTLAGDWVAVDSEVCSPNG